MDFVEENHFLVRRKVRQKSDERSLELLLTTLLIYSIVNYLSRLIYIPLLSLFPPLLLTNFLANEKYAALRKTSSKPLFLAFL